MSHYSMSRTYSKEWCQGFCTRCGTACADYCEDTYALRAENEKLKVRIEQHRGALGYSVQGNIPEDPHIQCGLCDAKRKQLEHLKARLSLAREALEAYAKLEVQDFNPCMPGECEWRDLGTLAREALEKLK